MRHKPTVNSLTHYMMERYPWPERKVPLPKPEPKNIVPFPTKEGK